MSLRPPVLRDRPFRPPKSYFSLYFTCVKRPHFSGSLSGLLKTGLTLHYSPLEKKMMLSIQVVFIKFLEQTNCFDFPVSGLTVLLFKKKYGFNTMVLSVNLCHMIAGDVTNMTSMYIVIRNQKE